MLCRKITPPLPHPCMHSIHSGRVISEVSPLTQWEEAWQLHAASRSNAWAAVQWAGMRSVAGRDRSLKYLSCCVLTVSYPSLLTSQHVSYQRVLHVVLERTWDSFKKGSGKCQVVTEWSFWFDHVLKWERLFLNARHTTSHRTLVRAGRTR